MGRAVAERTILRKTTDGSWESWGDVADRVALGNSLLVPIHVEVTEPGHAERERVELRGHIASGRLLMSGRHLQHGDADQPSRPMEVFTNCSTSATSFAQFLLLMSGSGVGRSYDDDLMVTNWDNAPNVRCVLSVEHPDFDWSAHEDVRNAKHKYRGKDVMWFSVPDDREGWAKALELWELAAFEKAHRDKTLILDFSGVRPKGAPIRGMQGRPASGPVPLMNAFAKAMTVKGSGMDPWMQSMYVDHYFAECVLVGGARRSARMSTKTWRDKNVFDFISIKRPIEFDGLEMDEVIKLREDRATSGEPSYDSFLWSSNNSVTVDAEFWELINTDPAEIKDSKARALCRHAHRVFDAVSRASYGDGTGEPGLINVDRLTQKSDGMDKVDKGKFFGSDRYQVEDETEIMLRRIYKRASAKRHYMIVNPCGEVPLSVLGGYCVIADVVPFHADSLDEAEEAFRAATRALVRVNTMKSTYPQEVARTNRIGVGVTGIHEFAWKFFGVGFKDLISVSPNGGFNPSSLAEEAALDFWMCMSRFSNAVAEEAASYSKKLGLSTPHTALTVKPAGCGTLDVKIRTTDGVRSFLEIFKSQDVCISEMQSGQWFVPLNEIRVFDLNDDEKRITKLYCNGEAEVYEVTMEDGSSYKFTGNHRFLTMNGWKRVDELDGSEEIVSFSQEG